MKNRKYLERMLFLTFFCLPLAAWSQGATQAVAAVSEPGVMNWMSSNIIAVLSIMTIIGAFATIIYLNDVLMQVNKMRLLQAHGIEVMEEVKLISRISREPWWKTWYQKLTRVVPVKKEEEILLDHSYDGIKELDNVLPPWWVYLFYLTIAFSVGYFFYFHVLDYGPGSIDEYEMEIAGAQAQADAYRLTLAESVDENNVVLVDDEMALSIGQTIFNEKCAVCHGQAGEGGVGPNLADDYWLHGGDIKDIFRVIKFGVPEKGMIAWSNQMLPGDIQKVSSYIKKMHGTNPPNPKAPQGERWEEAMLEDAAMVVDSVTVTEVN